MSYLQRAILKKMYAPSKATKRFREVMPPEYENDLDYWNSLEIYRNIFKIFKTKKTLWGLGFASPNSKRVILYRSLMSLQEQGFLTDFERCVAGMGYLCFRLTEKGKARAKELLEEDTKKQLTFEKYVKGGDDDEL